MKKLLTILFLAASFTFGQNISGTGTVNDPYLIYNAADLDSMRLLMDTHASNPGRYIKMSIQNDLDFSGTTFLHGNQYWWPINKTANDTIVIEGNGYQWANATIFANASTNSVTGEPAKSAGFFGNFTALNTALDTIRNIYFYNNNTKRDSTADIAGVISTRTGLGILWGGISSSNSTYDVVGENLFFRSCAVWDSSSSTAAPQLYTNHGIVVGVVNGCGLILRQVGVDSSLVKVYFPRIGTGTAAGGIVGLVYNSGFDLYESFIINSRVDMNASSAYWEFAGTVGTALIMGQYNTTVGYFYDCYAWNNILKPQGRLGGNSDPNVVGAIWGETNASLDNCYVAQNIYTYYSAPVETSELGWVGGYANHAVTGTTSIVDTTGLYNTGYAGLYGANSTTYPAAGDSLVLGDNTSMTTLSTYTGLGWDFSTTWDLDATIQDGYPYLQWAYSYLVSTTVTLNNPTGGETFEQDSVVTIHWSINPGPAQYIIGDYSTDGGSSWSRIDSVSIGDTLMTWTVPQNIYTNTGMVRVYSDIASGRDSSSTFTILPHAIIDFLYPIEKENQSFFVGDTAHLVIETIFVDNFLLYWSKDSTNWIFLDSVTVDTTNGFVLDTTTYIWTFDAEIQGPDVYGRAIAVGDTNLYVFEQSVITYDPGYPVGLYICQYDNGGDILEHYFRYDPSCGWSSPPHTYYTRLIPDDGVGPAWTYLSEAFAWPYTGADHPEPDFVYTISGSDTLPVPWTTFYDDPVDTLEYRQRDYYFDATDSTIRCNDLRNNITGIFVADLGPSWPTGTGVWTATNIKLQLYNIQRSKLIGQYVATGIDYETLNDPTFNPVILIGNPGTSNSRRTLGIAALSNPIDPLYPSDDELLFVNASIGRFYFRGIHPKINKEYNINWSTGEYEEEEE